MTFIADLFGGGDGGGGDVADALGPVDLAGGLDRIESTDWWTDMGDPTITLTSEDLDDLFNPGTQIGLYGEPAVDLGFNFDDPLAPLGPASFDFFPDAPTVEPYLNLGFDYDSPLTSGIDPYVTLFDPIAAQYGPIREDLFNPGSAVDSWFPSSGTTTASGFRVPSLSGGRNLPQSFDRRYAAAGMPQGVPYDYYRPPTGFLPRRELEPAVRSGDGEDEGTDWANIAKLAASIAGLGGAITGLLANLDAGDAAEELARLNREAAEREAAAARRQAQDEEEKLRNRTDRLLGRQAALYAKGGVRMSGSVLDVMADTEQMAQKDASPGWRAGPTGRPPTGTPPVHC